MNNSILYWTNLLKRENPGCLIRDISLSIDDNKVDYTVVYKDDRWTRKSRKLI